MSHMRDIQRYRHRHRSSFSRGSSPFPWRLTFVVPISYDRIAASFHHTLDSFPHAESASAAHTKLETESGLEPAHDLKIQESRLLGRKKPSRLPVTYASRNTLPAAIWQIMGSCGSMPLFRRRSERYFHYKGDLCFITIVKINWSWNDNAFNITCIIG